MSSQATRDFLTGIAAFALVGLPAVAQYPGQIAATDKSTPELRAVAVLEWTGDIEHPKASRLVPVSVFDGQQLQDGGLYLAQPEPLALEGEVEYQLKDNGKNTGLFVIGNAALEQGSWVGYGTWKPLAKPKPTQTASTQSWKDDEDSDRPTLHRKAHSDDGSGKSGSGSNGPAPDPDRPTLHRGGDGGSSGDSSSAGGSSSAPAPDPDRPVLHKSADETASSDADRPKLQKKDSGDDTAHVSSLPYISDPDRPRLIPGKPADMGPAVLPSLVGLPPDMEQAVAVSDSKNRPEHIWSYSWANPSDETKYKEQLEGMARTALGLNVAPAPTASPGKKNAAARSKTRLALPPPLPAPLIDEHFRIFELAYGAGATLVLSARTEGSGADEKFVTLVAQPDLYGNLAVLLKNVTDAAHLDDKPRMRLVDAVDAMADNRGELLFELRGQTQRQFALYRVLRGQIAQIFTGGTRDLSVAASQAAK
ncbi:MAG TPA: hypothetical protein VHD85_08805 [Terracidiphilus sp.]|nr:hypothetical protein [Terracidiphilus sp.]